MFSRYFCGSFLFLFLFFGCGRNADRVEKKRSDPEAPVKFSVLATVEPVAWIINRIGEGRLTSEVLVPAGKEPETFTPSTHKVLALVRNQIFFRVGLVSEEALIPKLQANASKMKIVDLRDGLNLIPSEHQHEHSAETDKSAEHQHEHSAETDKSTEHQHEHSAETDKSAEHQHEHSAETDKSTEHRHEHSAETAQSTEHRHEHSAETGDDCCGEDGMDPHFWMSPAMLLKAVESIEKELSELDPAGAANYRANATKLKKELSELQVRIRERLAPFKGRTILVFHPAYGYFCREFGLSQRAIEEGGRAPKPKKLSELIAFAKQEKIQLVIVQPEFGKESIDSLASSVGIAPAEHSPLIADYFKNLNELTDLIVRALSKK